MMVRRRIGSRSVPVDTEDQLPEQESHSEVQRLARGGSLAILGLGINGLLGFLFLKVVGDNFRTGSAGAIFIALSMYSILAFVAQMGADIGLLRYMPMFRTSDPGREASLSRISLIPTFIMAIVLAIVAFKFAPELASVAVRHGNRHLMEQQLKYLVPFTPFSAVMVVSLAGLRAWTIRPAVLIQNIYVPIFRIVILLAFVTLGHISALAVALSWGLPLVAGSLFSMTLLALRVRADRRADQPSGRCESHGKGRNIQGLLEFQQCAKRPGRIFVLGRVPRRHPGRGAGVKRRCGDLHDFQPIHLPWHDAGSGCLLCNRSPVEFLASSRRAKRGKCCVSCGHCLDCHALLAHSARPGGLCTSCSWDFSERGTTAGTPRS